MENLELDVMLVLDKMTNRISEDAKTIAMLEATIDTYLNTIVELKKQLSMVQELNQQ